ncbi:MAG: ribbon-helix-helix protein, CopG family [Oscillospiraceae bacterium]|nr:ribbon-helix-helix protein, CopG family [Oscillospiraceae bacterium]
MTISLRLNDEDSKIIKAYANLHGISVSELVRRAVLERIEDEYDLKAYNEAMEEYRKNPVSYSLEEIERELDL